ncbi:hypothetical protein F3Y22_tig00017996pilonHSYRG00047 [Hibiscus syriacus]|uniref:AMP-dependent synthetase/ligase domain-containing protein n=1 Tax=Hibiscus syriacus TaxID=106335 RepID=A0A6A3C168_HIBSY|nr:hypothetical protein F3Y22_tig00017996pilonHSYRG00047 [Hibiscus syriacus]
MLNFIAGIRIIVHFWALVALTLNRLLSQDCRVRLYVGGAPSSWNPQEIEQTYSIFTSIQPLLRHHYVSFILSSPWKNRLRQSHFPPNLIFRKFEEWFISFPRVYRGGDVVLIIALNSIFFSIVCLSVIHLGAVITTGQLVPKLAGSSIPVVLFDDEPSVTIEVADQVKILTTPEETHINTVPMFHIYGFEAFVIGKIANGTKVVILSKLDMNRILSTVEKFPTVNIRQGYTLTETTGVVKSMLTTEECRKYDSVGLLLPSLEAKIVDPATGNVLTIREVSFG